MNAVDPPLNLPRLTSESRVLRRGALGDQVYGRSREGRFLRIVEPDLIAHVGGRPTVTQKLLIRRLARGLLRLELLDERIVMGELTNHDARTFSALSNMVRLMARELGVQAAATVEKPPSRSPTSAAKIRIANGELLAGDAPSRVFSRARRWVEENRAELKAMWDAFQK